VLVRLHFRMILRLLNFLLSNCSWKGGELTAVFRQPFDMLADTNAVCREKKRGIVSPESTFEKWLPFVDTYRTFCTTPGHEAKELLLGAQQLTDFLAVRRDATGVGA